MTFLVRAVAASLVFATLLALASAGPCDDIVATGTDDHYSLTTLVNNGPFATTVKDGAGVPHTYQFMVCGGLPDPCQHQGGGSTHNCNARGLAGMCETWPGDGSACGGQWSGSVTLTAFQREKDHGVSLLYKNGDDCPCNPPERQTTIEIICDPSVVGLPAQITGNVPDPANLMYVISMRHANGCPTNRGGAHGLSGGSILLIIVFVVFGVYLVGGMVFNAAKGARGGEMVPNTAFWNDLPSLVGDGARFLITCGRGGNSYQHV